MANLERAQFNLENAKHDIKVAQTDYQTVKAMNAVSHWEKTVKFIINKEIV